MDRYGRKEPKELVSDISYSLNSFSFNGDEFCKAMDLEHRTLQQSFTRLCVKWLRHCADLEYYDGRNEASVKIGQIVKQALDEQGIKSVPMI